MINPYEAPQTMTKPATRVSPRIDPDLAVLQGAQYCARGGKLLMVAAISECVGLGVLIWIQQAKQQGPTNLLNLLGWILLSGSWFLLLAGAVVNLIGVARFVRYLDHEQLVKIFRACRQLVWFKSVMVIAVLAITGKLIYVQHRVVIISSCSLLMFLIIQSYFVHAKAMRIWFEHFPDPVLIVVRRMYLFSGIAATVFSFGAAAYGFQEAQEPSRLLLMGLMLLFALSFAAFADFYGRLVKALKSTESSAEIAAADD